MRYFITILSFAAAVTLTACRSTKQASDAIVTQAILPPMDLGLSTYAFRQATKRWPKDYGELSPFTNQSANGAKPIKYDRVDFTENPDGSLEIFAVAPGLTNQMTLKVTEDEKK